MKLDEIKKVREKALIICYIVGKLVELFDVRIWRQLF